MKKLAILSILMLIATPVFAMGSRGQGGSADPCAAVVYKAVFQSYTICWPQVLEARANGATPEEERTVLQECRADYIDQTISDAGC